MWTHTLHLVFDFSPGYLGGGAICRQGILSGKSEFERTTICLPYNRGLFCSSILVFVTHRGRQNQEESRSYLRKEGKMKKQIKTVAAFAVAVAMTMAPVMTASAAYHDDEYGYMMTEAEEAAFYADLNSRFPALTEMEKSWLYELEAALLCEDDEGVLADYCSRWSGNERAVNKAIAGMIIRGYVSRDWCVSKGANAAELDAFLAELGGNASATTVSQGTPTWKQDAKGWWVERPDGSYLVNEWFQSPASGLWYYMGADGYMLTNTTTPDGYKVNSDGVWVQ